MVRITEVWRSPRHSSIRDLMSLRKQLLFRQKECGTPGYGILLMGPEPYKQALNGKIYPDMELEADINKREEEKVIRNSNIYLHDANICQTRNSYLGIPSMFWQ